MAYDGVSGAVLLPSPLDGRVLVEPVGLQTFKSRTKIGLPSFLPSAMMARPLNSLPFKCPAFIGCQQTRTRQCPVHHLAKRPIFYRQEGRKRYHRTEGCIEIVAPLDLDPARRALLEDFHVVYIADLSHIVFNLLPRHVEWKLQVSDQQGVQSWGSTISVASSALGHCFWVPQTLDIGI